MRGFVSSGTETHAKQLLYSVPIKPVWMKGAKTLDIPFYFSVPVEARINWYKKNASEIVHKNYSEKLIYGVVRA